MLFNFALVKPPGRKLYKTMRINNFFYKMHLDMFSFKNETENLILFITKNCNTLTEQTHTNPRKILQVRLVQPQKKQFLFSPSMNLGPESNWPIGFTSLEKDNSIFKVTEEIAKFKFFITFPIGRVGHSTKKINNEVEEDLRISYIAQNYL